jgi:hypothetical protein
MDTQESYRSIMLREVADYFIKEGYTIVAAKELDNHKRPPAFRNDGYGDQKNKTPDIVGIHQGKKIYMIGIVRTGENDLESENSLTEYNVFLDQKDKTTSTPFLLCIIVPSSKMNEMTTLITRYIHPDYYPRISLIASTKCM